MFAFTTALVLAAAAAPSALATVFVTAPVASTSWAAGSNVTLTWQDDGASPSLSSFGPASIGLFVGNVNQQTLLQTISDSIDVGNATSITFTPDATVGANADGYFVRFQSLSLMDATNSAYPAQAFSAMFTMTGMTGTFNSTILAEMSATASASSTSAASTSASTKAATTSSKASTASAAATSAASDSTSGAESRAILSGVVGLAGLAVAGLAALF